MMPLGVLGDSDSESYAGTPERGGPFHAGTLQWTEVLARLRAGQVDPGAWDAWGVPGKLVALQRWLGLPLHGRIPRKFDYRYNFAISGSGCEHLMGGDSPQAPQLVALMDKAPDRWRRGVVVIRTGVNNFGKRDSLDRLARDPASPDVVTVMAACAAHIQRATALIRAHHPQTHIVLVGIFDNSHWPKYLGRWQSAAEIEHIQRGLDRFDSALRTMAQSDGQMSFFDDRAWFASRWGGRDAQGLPAYRALEVAPGLVVRNLSGDEPHSAVLADGHAGVVWNGLWAQSLVEFLNQHAQAGLRPITTEELMSFYESVGVSAGR